MSLPDTWTETTISGDPLPERVYRKAVGNRVCTLSAGSIDTFAAFRGASVAEVLIVEWAVFWGLKTRGD